MLHDPAVRVGEALLIGRLGDAELACVLRSPLGRAIRMPRPPVIVGTAATRRVSFTLARFQPFFGRLDHGQPRLAACDLRRQVHLGLVALGRIGRLGPRQQLVDLRFQLRLGLLHPPIAHRLVAAGVGLHLGAVDRDRPQLDQAALPRQLDHLHEQRRQFLQVQRPKVAQRAVRRKVAGSQHPERHVLMQLARQLPRREHARGVAVDQYLHHHRRVERLIARATSGVARVEGAQIQAVDGVADVVGQMPLGQPVLQGRRQQLLLPRLVGEIARRHSLSTPRRFIAMTHSATFCRADS